MTGDSNNILAEQFVSDSGEHPVVEIAKIRELIVDNHAVGRSDVELLFEINQKLGAADVLNESWAPFFTDLVVKTVVFDLDSPGEIDTEEGDWMATVFEKFGSDNEAESTLTENLIKTASSINGQLAARLGV